MAKALHEKLKCRNIELENAVNSIIPINKFNKLLAFYKFYFSIPDKGEYYRNIDVPLGRRQNYLVKTLGYLIKEKMCKAVSLCLIFTENFL